jgi:putative flippase GtrA
MHSPFPAPERLLSLRRLSWFVAVGTIAAAIHFGTVVALVQWGGWRPAVANVVGWLTAFVFSFLGHHRTTFSDAKAPMGRSAGRFFAVSALGFATNETAYVLLLHFSGLRYDLALAVVMVGIAGMTYLMGRHWAFRPLLP